MSTLNEVHELVQIAERAARTIALAEAEKVVRDMITETRWANEARLLNVAAARIGALT